VNGKVCLVTGATSGIGFATTQRRVIRHGADLLRAFTAVTSRRVSVILRKAYGGGFITMNSKDIGARASFAWPGAEIGVVGTRADAHLSSQAALGQGVVDAVIQSAHTRQRVSDVLFPSAASNGSAPAVHAGASGRGAPEATSPSRSAVSSLARARTAGAAR
jgi:acetyl-CoA carboxylase carboxyltransferase component